MKDEGGRMKKIVEAVVRRERRWWERKQSPLTPLHPSSFILHPYPSSFIPSRESRDPGKFREQIIRTGGWLHLDLSFTDHSIDRRQNRVLVAAHPKARCRNTHAPLLPRKEDPTAGAMLDALDLLPRHL